LKEFHREYELGVSAEENIKLMMLNELKQQIKKISPLSLKDELDMAIKEERYEDAAILRDLIRVSPHFRNFNDEKS